MSVTNDRRPAPAAAPAPSPVTKRLVPAPAKPPVARPPAHLTTGGERSVPPPVAKPAAPKPPAPKLATPKPAPRPAQDLHLATEGAAPARPATASDPFLATDVSSARPAPARSRPAVPAPRLGGASIPTATPPPSAPKPVTSGTLVGRTLDGKYEVLVQLGKGGMGTVYKARHVLLDEVVALKVINESLCDRPEVRTRFLREAKATMRFVHPNAVPVRDFGLSPEGFLYMTLDYSPGRSLRAVIEQGRMKESQAVAIARQCLRALEAAHAHGIVHRDLKPDNILIETGANEDVARIVDFGLAKLLDPSVQAGESLTGAVAIGTPQYMSPEQICGEAADHRSDLYSLGCILYELVTGARVFTAETLSKLLMKHLVGVPVKPSAIVPGVSPKLEELILKVLAKEPGERPQSAREMLKALDELEVGLRAPRALKVLLAEDNPVNQRLTQRMLERWGHQVVVAGDGAIALAKLAAQAFDVVVMDGQMPVLDGFAATRTLREREATTGRRTPVVALTADSTDEGKRRCADAGMDGHASKPIVPEQLFDELERVTRARTKSARTTRREVFDSKTALARVDEDLALLREVAELFQKDSARLVPELRQRAAAGDAKAVARIAYELKGAAGNLAANAVEDAAATLEKATQEGAELAPFVITLEQEIGALKQALAQFCAAA